MTEPNGYEHGVLDGYNVGPYGVGPDGEWVGPDGYKVDRMADPSYRKGLQDGRIRRINEQGDDHDALRRQADEAIRRHIERDGRTA